MRSAPASFPRSQGGGERDGLPTIGRVLAFYAEAGLPAPPIVVLSGDTSEEALERFTAAGATRVLRKPATVDTLRALLKLVHGRAAERLKRSEET